MIGGLQMFSVLGNLRSNTSSIYSNLAQVREWQCVEAPLVYVVSCIHVLSAMDRIVIVNNYRSIC